MEMENGWKSYWEDRVEKGEHYYGKEGANSDKIIKLLNINQRDIVLDIGCAAGAHLSDIKDKTKAECHGIDISPVAIKLNKDKRLKLKAADMENTGYQEGYFTKVFSLGVFEHTPNSIKPFLELNRIMKLGGLAYISVPNKLSLNHITKNVKMILGKWDLGYEKSFTKWEIKRLIAKSGFELVGYWVEPHSKPANAFNIIDNIINGINNQYLGFFNNFVIKKIKNV